MWPNFHIRGPFCKKRIFLVLWHRWEFNSMSWTQRRIFWSLNCFFDHFCLEITISIVENTFPAPNCLQLTWLCTPKWRHSNSIRAWCPEWPALLSWCSCCVRALQTDFKISSSRSSPFFQLINVWCACVETQTTIKSKDQNPKFGNQAMLYHVETPFIIQIKRIFCLFVNRMFGKKIQISVQID